MNFINAFRSKKLESTTTISGKIVVLIYKNKEFKIFDSGITCENICISCCKSLNILPTTRLLFGLRVVNSEEWLFPDTKPNTNFQYEFRMRFKVPELDNLYAIDPKAYDYMYYQIRYDMVHDRIDEIRFPNFKNEVLGLAAVDMYIDYAEKKGTEESIAKNYAEYLPPKIISKHFVFAKKEILGGFENFCKKTKSLSLHYVKCSYMDSFAKIAPNYLREKFNAIVETLPDGEDQIASNKSYQVTVDLDIYGYGGPSIKVSQLYKTQSFLVTHLENINALYLGANELDVDIDINRHIRKYHLAFAKPFMSKSFMTYVSGYLRLTTKWMFDPCVNYSTPSLKDLKKINCHGPVGGNYSYALIRESGKGRGTFIVRQCELEYDTYYIDILGKKRQPETFKITRGKDEWFLHMEDIGSFSDLVDLAKAIPTDTSHRYQIPVCEYDKPLSLLICVPRYRFPRNTENEVTQKKLQENRLQIFDPKRDLQLYMHSQTRSDCGKMTCHLAEWIQPCGFKNVKVTLKILNSRSDFGSFMHLSNTWSGIYSADFLKMYGLTLTAPHAVIVEHATFGPLNKFLYSKRKVPFRCLLDLATGLVRAVAFLQEKRIFHGRIRCSSLMVTDFSPEKNVIVAKLADPGIQRESDFEKELPWIPINLYDKGARAHQSNFYAEQWAFATTMWEIFARGQPIQHLTKDQLTQSYRTHGYILDMPEDEWPYEIRTIIMNGWSDGTRFDKMDILNKLSSLQPNSEINQSFIDDESNSDTISTSSNGTENFCYGGVDGHKGFYATVQILPEGELITKQLIGQGHFGLVYRGEIHYYKGEWAEVAIKVLKKNDKECGGSELDKEFSIMKGLDHPNIVKIITCCYHLPMSIVMEYLPGRSLSDYLKQNKPTKTLTNEKLLMFSLQIAKGMAYLSEMKIIHRDLAARNVLVDGEIAKISDFGLAQYADPKGYYQSGNNGSRPIKWYALESLLENKFSCYSDVWSYGVTLFEIFSRGDEPNLEGLNPTNLTSQDLMQRLFNGDRLKKPELCPPIVYETIMRPCWYEEKRKRPLFQSIVELIININNNFQGHI